jgi:membrane protease subunit HflK
MFLETMERVLGGADKVLIDQSAQGGQGVVPFLPLNDLQRRPSPQAGASQGQGAGQAQGGSR